MDSNHPFGNTVYETTYNDASTLEAMEIAHSDSFWHFDRNQFIANLPYNRMWQMAQNGTGKIITKVTKVVFEDGTVLNSRAKPGKKGKKSISKNKTTPHL